MSVERSPATHCPHGVFLREDICTTCMNLSSDDHWVCQMCGLSGNGIWADNHQPVCAGIAALVPEDTSELPF